MKNLMKATTEILDLDIEDLLLSLGPTEERAALLKIINDLRIAPKSVNATDSSRSDAEKDSDEISINRTTVPFLESRNYSTILAETIHSTTSAALASFKTTEEGSIQNTTASSTSGETTKTSFTAVPRSTVSLLTSSLLTTDSSVKEALVGLPLPLRLVDESRSKQKKTSKSQGNGLSIKKSSSLENKLAPIDENEESEEFEILVPFNDKSKGKLRPSLSPIDIEAARKLHSGNVLPPDSTINIPKISNSEKRGANRQPLAERPSFSTLNTLKSNLNNELLKSNKKKKNSIGKSRRRVIFKPSVRWRSSARSGPKLMTEHVKASIKVSENKKKFSRKQPQIKIPRKKGPNRFPGTSKRKFRAKKADFILRRDSLMIPVKMSATTTAPRQTAPVNALRQGNHTPSTPKTVLTPSTEPNKRNALEGVKIARVGRQVQRRSSPTPAEKPSLMVKNGVVQRVTAQDTPEHIPNFDDHPAPLLENSQLSERVLTLLKLLTSSLDPKRKEQSAQGNEIAKHGLQ
ncbi:unnamed protein product, partial [Strongylus vulgaris]